MVQNNLQPWSPKDTIQPKLQAQAALRSASPLRFIPVAEGLQFYGKHIGSMLTPLTREKFVQLSIDLFKGRGLVLPPEEARLFYDMFDSIDLYHNAQLSIGEMAGGLCSFFGGDMQACTTAVYNLLDTNKSNQVTKATLQEFLGPFIWAMVPANAAVLRPILTTHVTDDMFEDIASGQPRGYITKEHLLHWTHSLARFGSAASAPLFSSTVADRVATSIDAVLQVTWKEYQTKQQLKAYGQETWVQQHGNQPQMMRDVGVYRYVSNMASGQVQVAQAQQGPSLSQTVWNSVQQGSQQLYDHSANMYQAAQQAGYLNYDNWGRSRASTVDSVGTVMTGMPSRRSTAYSADMNPVVPSPPPPLPPPQPCTSSSSAPRARGGFPEQQYAASPQPQSPRPINNVPGLGPPPKLFVPPPPLLGSTVGKSPPTVFSQFPLGSSMVTPQAMPTYAVQTPVKMQGPMPVQRPMTHR